jgi:hypothetical protein
MEDSGDNFLIQMSKKNYTTDDDSFSLLYRMGNFHHKFPYYARSMYELYSKSSVGKMSSGLCMMASFKSAGFVEGCEYTATDMAAADGPRWRPPYELEDQSLGRDNKLGGEPLGLNSCKPADTRSVCTSDTWTYCGLWHRIPLVGRGCRP